MSPTPDPVPRARRPWGWLSGIFALGILGGAVVAFAMLLWDYVDMQALTHTPRTEVAGVLPEPSTPIPAARLGSGFSAYLYHSEATRGFFPDEAFYPSILEHWRELLEVSGAEVEELRGAAAIAALEGEGVVAVPAAICLDDAEVDALFDHAGGGGGLLLSWATAARDGECEWRGWEALRDLTGAGQVRQIEERSGVFLTVPANGPLGQGVEPAARIELHWDAQVSLSVEGTRVYWSDWALNPAPAEGTEAVDAAAHLHRTGSGGRVAWFGFNGGEGATPLDERRIERLHRNGVDWVAGHPSASIMAWPDGHRAAFAVTQQLGWEFPNAEHLAEIAGDRGFPVTFFATSRTALDHPGLAGVIAAAGEIGTRGPDDQLLAGLPRAEQRDRLERSRTQIRGWAEVDVVGLRPPEERFDVETLEAWAGLGGRYVVGVSNSRTGGIELYETENGPIALLPRVVKDDYNVLVQDRTMRGPDLTAELGGGVTKVGALGGLALLTTHSQLAGASRHVGAIGDVVDQVRGEGGWWIATGGELAEWAIARGSAGVVIERAEAGLEVEVRAAPDAGLSGAWARVVLPAGGSWEPWADGGPIEFAPDPSGIVVPLPDLGPGEAWRFEIREARAA